jgi:2-C-methyl-D-erythritol 2,4-cyclodiphosphate synthase
MKVRVGFGFDVHQLGEQREFWLGGIKVPSDKGAIGHSDADVLIHAICDALLGAAGLRDIGFHFPDTSAEFKGIDSKILLKRVIGLLSEKGYSVGNVDSTICLEAPKINPHIAEMKRTLAGVIGIDEEDIAIKATTNEKMGYVGRKEGICAYSAVLIYKD